MPTRGRINPVKRAVSLKGISEFKSAVTSGGNKVKTALFPSLNRSSGMRRTRR